MWPYANKMYASKIVVTVVAHVLHGKSTSQQENRPILLSKWHACHGGCRWGSALMALISRHTRVALNGERYPPFTVHRSPGDR
eukprot:357928-Chlamydomonas_euryale.AAC.1